jgi:minor extracellular serine protease Vpr
MSFRFFSIVKKNCLLVSLLLGFVPVLFGQVVPGRYIVELDGESVSQHLNRVGGGRQSPAALGHRAVVRAQQQVVRRQVEQLQGHVVDTADTVTNSLFVEASDSAAAQLAAIPGVKRVVPVRQMHLLLDHALALHRVVDAWQQIGKDQAGKGIKIGIIDTGISSGHAGFQDSSLTVPDTYPRTNADSDKAYTNNKIIVARSYVSLLPNHDPDQSVRDHVGHGTAVAMTAAGVTNTGPKATITGVAPKSWLGVYKVFGTPGYNDSASDDAILKALDDAVSDGMDVVNLSLGTDFAPRLGDDPDVAAVEQAYSMGVIVVISAGNSGPNYNSISSPATAPHALAVGATTNDRKFAAKVSTGDSQGFLAVVGSSNAASAPLTPLDADLVDVSSMDGDGQACSAYPDGALNGKIALIRRGTCTFEVKANDAQKAGAIGAVIYANSDSPAPITMQLGASTLPAEMISYSDGASLKQSVSSQGSVHVTMQFTASAVAVAGNQLSSFSAAGPNVDTGIKPDLMAVGSDIYMATQTLDPNGAMYDGTGYVTEGGTSFSSPLVAGAIALLKSARPGLSPDQYRSLLINTAQNAMQSAGQTTATVQEEGGGILDALAALGSTVVTSPVSLSFGSGGKDLKTSQSLTITNIGPAPDTYTLAAIPANGGPTPSFGSGTVDVGNGSSVNVPVNWQATGLKDGSYEGVLTITAASTGKVVHVPYWYAATSGTPAQITVMNVSTGGRRGALVRQAVLFRITDVSGVTLGDATPTVTVTSGGGSVSRVNDYDSQIPGLFGIDVRLGPSAGANVFHIEAGSASLDVTVTGS